MDWSQIAGTLAQVGLTGLGTAFGGPAGGIVGNALGSAIAKALGVEPTPQAVQSAILENPDLAKARLADLENARQVELASYQAQLADVQNARGTLVGLAQNKSDIAWAPVVLSMILVFVVVGIVGSVGMNWLREDGIIVGWALGTGTTVVTYWLGSSSGSKRNADAVRKMAADATIGRAVRN